MEKVAETLNKQDATDFKILFKLYETKAYKKGLKLSEKLLENIPGHPETSSMKAIFLYFTGKQDEGLQAAKEALNKGLKSEICWHIYGIINRTQRNYKEAAKCYKMALMIAPENLQILRDLSILQVQVRDIEGMCQTRLKILLNKEGLVINWVSYAVGLHLNKNYKSFFEVMESIKRLIKDNPIKRFEDSEITLYEAMVIQEQGDIPKFLQFLNDNDQKIVDRQKFQVFKVQAFIALNQHSNAIPIINNLISENINNSEYYKLYLEALQVKTKEEEVKSYEDLLLLYPTCAGIKFKLLEITEGDVFITKFSSFIKSYYRSGKPSIFKEIKNLYKFQDKVNIIEEILLKNKGTLEKNATFWDSPDTEESPMCNLWNYMVLAQHFNKIGKNDTALEFINDAIKHTPTLIELYIVKAKIYKHFYNNREAFFQADQARQLDLADRYLNNKAIKYALRDNQQKQSELLIRMFLKDPTDGNAFDLQTLWYEQALADSYVRSEMWGWAMRVYKYIEKHFSDMYEDQFDFHTYCLRKYTLISYINFIRYQNDVYNQKFYIKTSINMIKMMIKHVGHKQKKIKEEEEEKLRQKNMNNAERKKFKKQQEKDQKDQESDPQFENIKKLDLDGKQFLEKLDDPLVEANLFAQRLIEFKIENTTLSYEAFTVLIDFFIIKNKPLQVMRALTKLINNNNRPNDVIIYKIRTLTYLEQLLKNDSIKPNVKEIIQKFVKNILGEASILNFVEDQFKHQDQKQILTQLSAWKCHLELKQIDQAKLIENTQQLLLKVDEQQKIDQVVFIFEELNYLTDKKISSEIRQHLQKMFPLSGVFVQAQAPSIGTQTQEEEQKI